MRRAIAIILETILFLAAFALGFFSQLLHLPLWTITLSPTRYFVLDGPVLMVALYVLILLIGAARRRVASAALTATVAFVLALVLGLALKFGFASR